MRRRAFLTVAGTTAVISVAGCLGGDDDEFDTPGAVVEAYYETETEEETTELLHTESTTVLAPPTEGFDIEPAGEPEIVAENLDEAELEAYVTHTRRGGREVIADQNNAKIEMPVERVVNDDRFEETEEWIVAEDAEEGEWLIVARIEDS